MPESAMAFRSCAFPCPAALVDMGGFHALELCQSGVQNTPAGSRLPQLSHRVQRHALNSESRSLYMTPVFMVRLAMLMRSPAVPADLSESSIRTIAVRSRGGWASFGRACLESGRRFGAVISSYEGRASITHSTYTQALELLILTTRYSIRGSLSTGLENTGMNSTHTSKVAAAVLLGILALAFLVSLAGLYGLYVWFESRNSHED